MTSTLIQLTKKAFAIRHKLKYCMMCYVICIGAMPLISLGFIDIITKKLTVNPSLTEIILIIFVFFICEGLSKILAIYSESKADTMITFIRMEIQNELNEKLFQIDYRLLENRDFLNENYRIFQSLNSSEVGVEYILKMIVYMSGLILSVISIMYIITIKLGIIVLAFAVYIVLGCFAAIKNARYRDNHQDKYSDYERKMDYVFGSVNDYGYTKDIMIFKADELLKNKFQKSINEITELLGKSVAYNLKNDALIKGIYFVLTMILYFVVVINGYYSNVIDVSGLCVSIYAMINFATVSEDIFKKVEKMCYESVAVTGLLKYLNEEKPKCTYNKINDYENEYDLEIENLSYRYRDKEEFVLKNINLKIKHGEKIALVGLNGAGKSTLIKCISGLYKDYDGVIKYMGNDIRKIDEDEYKEKIGVLFQDADIYPFKIWENVSSSDQNLNIERVEQVISCVGLDNKLLTDGYMDERYLKKLFHDDGIELSGGEIQKLMIARLIYKNPKLIILDEPTARMDNVVEKNIINLINEKFRDNSFLFVTHRLSSAINMDRIALLKDGVICELGTHEELMQQQSEYYRLFEIQKNYYTETENV